jgi:hypothetical protein
MARSGMGQEHCEATPGSRGGGRLMRGLGGACAGRSPHAVATAGRSAACSDPLAAAALEARRGPCSSLRRLPVEPNGRKGATTRVVTVFGMRPAPGQCEQVNWLSSRTHAIGPRSFADRLDDATPPQPVVTALTVFTTCVHGVSTEVC